VTATVGGQAATSLRAGGERPYLERMSTLLRAAVGLPVLLLAGCAVWPGGAPEEEIEPPAIEVVNDGSRFELTPWSGCISEESRGEESLSMCWDGYPEDPVDIGTVAARLEVASPLEDWRWEAVARDPSAEPGVGVPDGRRTVTVEHDDDARRLVLNLPSGGPFAVDLRGRGAGGDDASYTFIAVGVS
jgi:hypothetical protein